LETAVETRIEALLGGVAGTTVPVTLEYRREDPFAVAMVFGVSARTGRVMRWVFGRELLIAGLVASDMVGDGDVKLGRGSDEYLVIQLASPSGEATLLFPLAEVSRFVGQVLVEVPLGLEPVDENELVDELAAPVRLFDSVNGPDEPA
jgi:hypothetical protein